MAITTVRPPAIKKTPRKSAGPYTGLHDPTMTVEKWDRIGQDLYENGFNEICFFVNLACPRDFWYWPFEDGKFNFGKVNQPYSDNLFNCVERLTFWHQTVKLKINNDYHEGPNDPFVQGLAPYDGEKHYSSVVKEWKNGKVVFTFYWISWEEPTPRPKRKYTNFKTLNAFGRGMELMLDDIIKRCSEVRDLKLANGTARYKDFRIALAWANETMALFSEDGKTVKTLGDRDELTYWMRWKFEDAGFINGKNMLLDVDYLAFKPRVGSVDYSTMADVSNDLDRKGFHLEIHGLLTAKPIANDVYGESINSFVKAGVNPRAIYSSDGDLKMEGDGQQGGSLQTCPQHTDRKIDLKRGQPMFANDFYKFWKAYFPPYKNA